MNPALSRYLALVRVGLDADDWFILFDEIRKSPTEYVSIEDLQKLPSSFQDLITSGYERATAEIHGLRSKSESGRLSGA